MAQPQWKYFVEEFKEGRWRDVGWTWAVSDKEAISHRHFAFYGQTPIENHTYRVISKLPPWVVHQKKPPRREGTQLLLPGLGTDLSVFTR